MVVREMLATDLGETQDGFYLWGTQKSCAWAGDKNGPQAEWKMVYIPTGMTGLVKEALRRNRAVRITYRNDLPIYQADSVQVI